MEKATQPGTAATALGQNCFAGALSESDATPVIDALRALAVNDALFRFSEVRGSQNLPMIMEQVYSGTQFVGDATRMDESQESGADVRVMFRSPNGKEFYVYHTSDEVWIDVSRLDEGDGGAGGYAAVGNYAFNARKVFVGDPAGLSRRR